MVPQSQLAVANQSLSESRGEVDKLLTQLKSQKECEDAAMSSAKKKHASEVRAMQQKVSLSYQACICTRTQYWPTGVKSVALAQNSLRCKGALGQKYHCTACGH